MTWGNLGVRLLGFVILLPLVLRQLTVEETSLWLLFQAILVLQGMVDFGFTPTFIRIISYARSGKLVLKGQPETIGTGIEIQKLTRRVISTMRYIYNRLSVLVFLLMTVMGSLAVMKPLSHIDDTSAGWFSWAVIVVVSVVAFRGAMFGAYMQGTDQIALFQRWKIVTGTISIIGAIIVLLVGGDLLPLVVALQSGIVVDVLVTRQLAIRHAPNTAWNSLIVKDPEIMQKVWPAAWRSGLGVAMTYGTIQGTGVIFAQFAPPAEAASFLLAQRIVRTISSFANAPFYTRIPRLALMYAEGKEALLVESARIGMRRANWILLLGIVVVGLSADPILALVGSQTPFVPNSVWLLLGLAALTERIGAMHLQLYSTTNHIVWHVANGITGGIMLCAIPFCYSKLGVLGLPLGMLIGYIVFYLPYCTHKSYSRFELKFFHMDGFSSVVPALLLSSMFCVAYYNLI